MAPSHIQIYNARSTYFNQLINQLNVYWNATAVVAGLKHTLYNKNKSTNNTSTESY